MSQCTLLTCHTFQSLSSLSRFPLTPPLHPTYLQVDHLSTHLLLLPAHHTRLFKPILLTCGSLLSAPIKTLASQTLIARLFFATPIQDFPAFIPILLPRCRPRLPLTLLLCLLPGKPLSPLSSTKSSASGSLVSVCLFPHDCVERLSLSSL